MNASRHIAWSAVPRALRFPLVVVERSPDGENDTGMAVAVCAGNADAERAVRALAHGDFDMTKLSIVGTDYHSVADVAGGSRVGNRVRTSGRNGESWAGMWGRFSGFAIFEESGIEPIVVAGPLVAAIVSILERATSPDGSSTLGAALAGLGLPDDRVVACRRHVEGGRYVVVASGTRADARHASDVLTSAGIAAHELYLPGVV